MLCVAYYAYIYYRLACVTSLHSARRPWPPGAGALAADVSINKNDDRNHSNHNNN